MFDPASLTDPPAATAHPGDALRHASARMQLAQELCLFELRGLMGAWCDRRHEAASAAHETVLRLTDARSHDEVAGCLWTFLAGSARRLADDVSDQIAAAERLLVFALESAEPVPDPDDRLAVPAQPANDLDETTRDATDAAAARAA